MYHIFSDNRDEWIRDRTEADELYDYWLSEYGSTRLYSCEYNEAEDIYDDIDCLRSNGDFPV